MIMAAPAHQKGAANIMTPGSLGHTTVRTKTFFYNANLLGFRPAPTAASITDREDLNFGSVSMLGHSVGFNRKTSVQKDGPAG